MVALTDGGAEILHPQDVRGDNGAPPGLGEKRRLDCMCESVSVVSFVPSMRQTEQKIKYGNELKKKRSETQVR